MKLNPDESLIFVGWVEARNPTYQIELYPTYLNPDFFSGINCIDHGKTLSETAPA
jgi:hypothetical protein